MGTGQTLQEGGWFDFYALMPLHAATVPGMRWYNHLDGKIWLDFYALKCHCWAWTLWITFLYS